MTNLTPPLARQRGDSCKPSQRLSSHRSPNCTRCPLTTPFAMPAGTQLTRMAPRPPGKLLLEALETFDTAMVGRSPACYDRELECFPSPMTLFMALAAYPTKSNSAFPAASVRPAGATPSLSAPQARVNGSLRAGVAPPIRQPPRHHSTSGRIGRTRLPLPLPSDLLRHARYGPS